MFKFAISPIDLFIGDIIFLRKEKKRKDFFLSLSLFLSSSFYLEGEKERGM